MYNKKDFSNRTICIVDDTESNVFILKTIIEKQFDCNVITAFSGEEALSKIEETKPDIILLDIMMPGISGFEVAEKLSKKTEYSDIPIIFITALDKIDDKVKAFESGAVDYVVKPFKFKEIEYRVRTHLEKKIQYEQILNNEKYISKLYSLEKAVARISSYLITPDFNDYEKILKIISETFGSESCCILDLKNFKDSHFFCKYTDRNMKDKKILFLKNMFDNIDKFEIKVIDKQNYPESFTEEQKKFFERCRFNKFIIAPLLSNDKELLGIILLGYENKIVEIPMIKNVFQVICEMIVRDFERKKTLKQIMYSEKLSAVGQLASGVAHEFNNILAIIMGKTQLNMFVRKFEDNSEDKELKESLEIIIEQCKRGKTIVSKVSAFSAPSKPVKKLVYLKDMIDNMLKFQQKQLEINNVTVKTDVDKNYKIYVDANQIEQVFLNLIINASQAITPKGSGTIDIKVIENPGNYIIEFSDNGIGIEEKNKDNIFNPFYSTKSAYAKDNYNLKGLGIGLSVVYKIIKLHKGTIEVESKKDEGTKFIIKLPRETEINNKKFNKTNRDLSGIKVAFIDDEFEILDSMKKIMTKFNVDKCNVFEKGTEFFETFDKSIYDIVFIDMMMPDMKGDEIINKIRNIDKNINVVIASGKHFSEDELDKINCDYFLKKPFDINEVIRILKNIKS